MTLRPALICCLLGLAGCVGTGAPTATRAPILPVGQSDLPPMKLFGQASPERPSRANEEIAQDFLDLSFRLESGREIPRFARFTAPITVRMTGAVPPTAPHDLAALIARLRSEAGLAVRQTDGSDAAITVEFLPRRQIQAWAPDAACFVAPRVSSFSEYRRASRATVDWSDYIRRERAAVFIPADTAPQEIRDCLHEELAQALGPLNDLYRLPDSVFNDDNIHTTLTGFDMLILRATYAPELTPGMTKEAVALTLPGILARLNPGGQRPGAALPPTPRVFGQAIARALGPGSSPAARRSAAEEALRLSEGWQDARTGFALLTVGRLSGPGERARAFAAFSQAAAIFRARALPLYAAHADMQLATFALAQGDWARADAIAQGAIPVASRDQNAALLASLMMVRSEALARMGREAEAQKVRLDCLGWARYGMASDTDVRRRLAAIAAIAAQGEVTIR